ncbi:signal peptidase I [Desulforamulus aeronauticus]|nr:signal peptidase I [Desulforamulus aeronauticus]
MAMRSKVYNGAELPEDVLKKRFHQLRRKKEWYRLIRSLVATALTVFFLFGVFCGVGIIRGQSMIPSFQDGDLVLFWRLSKDYARNDVIFFERETWQCELIKRIVAVPGDTVDADSEGRLMVNAEVLKDTHTKPGIGYPLTLLENEYFVLGDNREAAMDSRNFGPVDKRDIDGKVILVLRTQVN